jgi:hypothetical protein
MKKLGISAALLAAGVVVASGLFAQEIKFDGYVNSGLGLVLSTEEDAPDPYIAVFGTDSWNDAFTVRFNATYTNAAGNAGANLRFQAAAGNNAVSLPFVYGWFSAFNNILTVKGGIVDDATWHTGGAYFGPDSGEGVGALVKVTPIGGLDIGVGAYVAEVPPGHGDINIGNGPRDLDNAKYTFNAAYTLPDLLKVTATFRPKADFGSNALWGDDPEDMIPYWNPKTMTSRAQVSVSVLAVPNLKAIVELELDNLQDFSALKAGDKDAWDRIIPSPDEDYDDIPPDLKGITPTGASGKINIAETFEYKLGDLTVGLWAVEWISQAEDTDFSFYANPWVSYALGSIVPRLDLGYGSGARANFRNDKNSNAWRRGNIGVMYNSDYSIIAIRPSVKFNLDPNTFVEIGDLLDIDGGPEKTWGDDSSRISNAFYVDFKWSF